MTKEQTHVLPEIDMSNGMEIGLYTLGDHLPNPHTGKRISAEQRLNEIVEMAQLAEEAGLDVFQIGESHQDYFVTQAHLVLLSNIARATNKIKLSSGSTIISTSDPVRVFEDAATIDLLSAGRMEVVAGRASRVGLYDLLGYSLNDYEELFEEKFDLLLQINENEFIDSWEGEFRAPLRNAHVIPRAHAGSGGFPIWRAVGGSVESAQKAGRSGVPMYQAHLGGSVEPFKYRIDLYREVAKQFGYDVQKLPVATAGFFYTRENTMDAYREYYPNINEGMIKTNGQGFPKRAFAQGQDVKSVINVGSPELIIEKLLYQHENFGHQRYIAQIDFGGVTMDDIKRTIDIMGTKIVPQVKKYTKK